MCLNEISLTGIIMVMNLVNASHNLIVWLHIYIPKIISPGLYTTAKIYLSLEAGKCSWLHKIISSINNFLNVNVKFVRKKKSKLPNPNFLPTLVNSFELPLIFCMLYLFSEFYLYVKYWYLDTLKFSYSVQFDSTSDIYLAVEHYDTGANYIFHSA